MYRWESSEPSWPQTLGEPIVFSLVAQLVKNPPAMQETLLPFLSQEAPLEKDRLPTPVFLDFPSGSHGKESACLVGDLGLAPGLGRSPGGGHGHPLQCSCLENPHGQRSLAGYSLWSCKELDMTGWLRTAQSFQEFSPQTYWTLAEKIGKNPKKVSKCGEGTGSCWRMRDEWWRMKELLKDGPRIPPAPSHQIFPME